MTCLSTSHSECTKLGWQNTWESDSWRPRHLQFSTTNSCWSSRAQNPSSEPPQLVEELFRGTSTVPKDSWHPSHLVDELRLRNLYRLPKRNMGICLCTTTGESTTCQINCNCGTSRRRPALSGPRHLSLNHDGHVKNLVQELHGNARILYCLDHHTCHCTRTGWARALSRNCQSQQR